jgi:hypothetical protein
MKKRRILILALIAVVAVVGVVSAGMYKMKMKSKSAYADLKIESTTMPAIYHEIVQESNPFTLYGRNDEMIPILEKMLGKGSQ